MKRLLLASTSLAVVLGATTGWARSWEPVIDTYGSSRAQYVDRDLRECRGLANQAGGDSVGSGARGALRGGLVGAAGGAAIGAALGNAGRGAAVIRRHEVTGLRVDQARARRTVQGARRHPYAGRLRLHRTRRRVRGRARQGEDDRQARKRLRRQHRRLNHDLPLSGRCLEALGRQGARRRAPEVGGSIDHLPASTDDDVAWLTALLGAQARVFPTGGHLGNLHRPEVHAEIMASLADLAEADAAPR